MSARQPRRHRDARGHTLMHFALRQIAESRFPRHTDQNRPLTHSQLSQICEQLDIVTGRFPEPETRINNERITLDSSSDATLYTILKESRDV